MSPEEFSALTRLERLDAGGDVAFHRVKHAGHDAVLIEGSNSWVPWADPAIFCFADRHPHLVHLLGTDLRDNEASRAVIAWAEGPSIQELLRDERLSEEESLVVLRDVLDALLTLAAARGSEGVLNLYHGALSPRWLHVDGQGHTSVGGAGLGGLKPETSVGRVAEALLFAAPEAILAQEETSSSSDVFALGALFQYFVSGSGIFGSPDGNEGQRDVIQAMRRGTRRLAKTDFAPLIKELSAPLNARPSLDEAVALFDDALTNVEVARVRQGLGDKATRS